MITTLDNLGLLKLIFDMRGSIIPTILPKMLFAFIVAIAASLNIHVDILKGYHLEFGTFTARIVDISLLLGFHSNEL